MLKNMKWSEFVCWALPPAALYMKNQYGYPPSAAPSSKAFISLSWPCFIR